MTNGRFILRLALLGAALLLLLASPPAMAQGIQVYVDGQRVAFDQPPVLMSGRTLVPLRGVFEQMGASVVWNASTRTVLATRGSTSVSLPIGGRYAIVDGRQLALDQPAILVGARTLVPLRFIAESLGASVDWSAATRTVTIASAGDVGGTPPPVTPPPVADRPDIFSVSVNPMRPLNAGEVLQVSMTGDAGGQATFDVVGLRNGIFMSETTSGRYEGSLQITSDMSATAAPVVVHLTRNGMTDTEQASASVTLNTSAGLIGLVDLQPNSPYYIGQSVTVIAQGVANATATMDVGARYGLPMTQISPGVYRGTFTVSSADRDGRVMVHLRTFDGRTASRLAEETLAFQGGGLFLQVYEPADGQSVGGIFTVRGQTVSHATVDITATPIRPILGGVINIAGDPIRRTVQADANGNFSTTIDATNVAADADMQIGVVARDQFGNASTQVELEVALP